MTETDEQTEWWLTVRIRCGSKFVAYCDHPGGPDRCPRTYQRGRRRCPRGLATAYYPGTMTEGIEWDI